MLVLEKKGTYLDWCCYFCPSHCCRHYDVDSQLNGCWVHYWRLRYFPKYYWSLEQGLDSLVRWHHFDLVVDDQWLFHHRFYHYHRLCPNLQNQYCSYLQEPAKRWVEVLVLVVDLRVWISTNQCHHFGGLPQLAPIGQYQCLCFLEQRQQQKPIWFKKGNFYFLSKNWVLCIAFETNKIGNDPSFI